MTKPALSVRDLRVEFRVDEGDVVQAVNGVSFDLMPGKTLGIVGESGSGKSVTNLALLRLIPEPPGRIVSGEAWFEGIDLLKADERELERLRGSRIAMIFQEPMTALNPYLSIEEQLTEVTRRHLGHTAKEAREHAVRMLERVGITDARRRLASYPHEYSGGMRQRVMIAMALLCNPKVLIADEPTTALDVTIQSQILDLLRELQEEFGTSILFITHDLGVVANVCHDVIVMYAGRIVERAPATNLFRQPFMPYTLGLLKSVPRWDSTESRLIPIEGHPPDMTRPPSGCPFHPRCPYMEPDKCIPERPPLMPRPDGEGEKACWFDIRYKTPRALPVLEAAERTA
jgi:oligopeptide transport system ATP-binding protein